MQPVIHPALLMVLERRHARVLLKFRRARQERRRTMVDRKLSSFKAGSYEIPKQKGVEDF